MFGLMVNVNPSSESKEIIHSTSVVVDATARNSASVDDRAKVGWHFELQDMGLHPR